MADASTAGWQPGAGPTGVLARTELLGRDVDGMALARRCAEARVVSVLGPGGTGKTTLTAAVVPEVAAELDAEAWWVDLQRVPPGEPVAPVIADTIGVAIGGDGAQTPALTLAESLGDRSAVLVLDNCEHVVEPVAALLEELLPLCPGTRIVATTREVLGVVGEVPLRLPPLELPVATGGDLTADDLLTAAATTLFLRRSGIDPDDLPGGDVAAVAAICRQLDGLPLAIELAAARSPALSPRQIEAALEDRFRVLTSRRRTAQGRQRTLEASIGWSYDLLTEDEQQLLRSLAVFPSGFDLTMAAIVGGDRDEVTALDLVTGLVDKSLVAIQRRPSGRRFRLLESVRAFGEERLLARDELDEVRDRHVAATVERLRTLQLADDHEGVVLRGDDWLGDELDDVRVAADRAVATGRPAVAVDLWWAIHFWVRYSPRDGFRSLLADGLDPIGRDDLDGLASLRRDVALRVDDLTVASRGAGSPHRAVVVDDDTAPLTSFLARLWTVSGASSFGSASPAELVDEARELADLAMARPGWGEHLQQQTLRMATFVLEMTGDRDEALALVDATPPGTGTRLDWWVPMRRMSIAASEGHPDVLRLFEEAIRSADARGRLTMVDTYGWVVGMLTGDLDQVEAWHEQHLSYRPPEGTVAWLDVCNARGYVALARGRVEEALALLEPALARARELPGTEEGRFEFLTAYALLSRGDVAAARATLERLRREPGHPYTHDAAGVALSEALLTGGDAAGALDIAIEVGIALTDVPRHSLLPWTMLDAASALVALDRHEDAARTLGALDRDLAVRGAGLWPHYATMREVATTACREALGDQVSKEALEAGRELSWREWVAWLARGRGERATDRPAAGWAALTDAERDVAVRAAEGLSTAELAAALFVSRNTVKTHLKRIYVKLDVSSRVELAGVVREHT